MATGCGPKLGGDDDPSPPDRSDEEWTPQERGDLWGECRGGFQSRSFWDYVCATAHEQPHSIASASSGVSVGACGGCHCTIECDDDDDCPPPPSGNARASCEGEPRLCVPRCDRGETCPDGMQCSPDGICAWVVDDVFACPSEDDGVTPCDSATDPTSCEAITSHASNVGHRCVWSSISRVNVADPCASVEVEERCIVAIDDPGACSATTCDPDERRTYWGELSPGLVGLIRVPCGSAPDQPWLVDETLLSVIGCDGGLDDPPACGCAC